ncbi:MAG TPA: RnfH family protein [Gammaproteobacteria bacterium]|nr:RnfH family protein [Gammaproteobacteria bacterium]
MPSVNGLWRSTVSESEVEKTVEETTDFTVEVAFATPEKQLILEQRVVPGTTLEQAVELSGILDVFSEIDLSKNRVGIFGKLAKKNLELKPGDRVEIYRPLIADPKEVRRKREAEGKRMKKGGGEAPTS